MKRLGIAVAASLFLSLTCFPTHAADGDATRLAKELAPLWSCLSSDEKPFTITAKVDVTLEGKSQVIEGWLSRTNGQTFALELKHPEFHGRRTAVCQAGFASTAEVDAGKGEHEVRTGDLEFTRSRQQQTSKSFLRLAALLSP